MALRYRATAALVKGASMGMLGLWVSGVTAWHAWHGTLPEAVTMGAVGASVVHQDRYRTPLRFGAGDHRLDRSEFDVRPVSFEQPIDPVLHAPAANAIRRGPLGADRRLAAILRPRRGA